MMKTFLLKSVLQLQEGETVFTLFFHFLHLDQYSKITGQRLGLKHRDSLCLLCCRLKRTPQRPLSSRSAVEFGGDCRVYWPEASGVSRQLFMSVSPAKTQYSQCVVQYSMLDLAASSGEGT